MSEWKEVKLGDVCEIVGGGTPSTKKPEYWNGDISWITPKDLSNYQKKYIFSGERNITEEGLKNSSTKILPKGTILFTSRAPIGYIAIAGKELCTNQGFKSLICKKEMYNQFLYYLMKYKTNEIIKLANGSTFKEISATNLKKLSINLPPLPIQKKIADILSVIDEKIETLQNINETLEEMAKAIFKSWFVDFEIVKAKASGKNDSEIAEEFGINKEIVKLFPSEFETSEIGKIPKGWKVGSFEKDCQIVYGKNLPKSKLKKSGYPVFGANGIIGYYDKFLYEKPQITIGCRGIAGKVNITLPYSFITNNSLIIEIKNDKLTFDYMKELAYFTDFSIYATGSVQPQITITNIKKYKFLIPSQKLIDYFTKITSNFNKFSIQYIYQLQTLQKLRDTLLPKLINGEIEVDNLDIKGLDEFN
jgi:type I restriction enzyme S subunit